MKILKLICTALASSLLLVACGGGNTLTGPPGGSSSGGSSSVTAVKVHASPATVAADGSTTSSITATALDTNNASVAGVTMAFGVSNGGAIAVVKAITDTSGNATATLSNLSAAPGSNLTVTATAGTVNGTTTVGVVAIKQSLTLQTDAPQIPSSATTAANISALLRDANNNALPGVTVTFSSTSGVLTVSQAVTDANGLAKATLSAGTDPSYRNITVTASAGTATANLMIAVTGTTLGLTGPANLVLGNVGNYSVVLTNSSNVGIPGASVALSSANGNTLSAAMVTTDGSGRATFTVTGAAGGNDTITAVALGLTKTLALAVSSQSFNVTAPADNTKVFLGVSQTVTVTWLSNGAPVVGQNVAFAATRGTLVPTTAVMTNASGQASVAISSTVAGPSIVQATAAGVSAQVNLDFVATTPSQISVQAGPASIAVQMPSTITALVRDAANNLVEGATVVFQLVTDPTNGGLTLASAVTDAQGRAQTVYQAGSTSSGANGVKISASVTPAGGSAITASTTLTVGGQTVFLSLGTGNTIDVSQGVAIYQITYTVFAVDSNGAPVAGVSITASVLPVAYGKGKMGGCPGGQYWGAIYYTLASDPDSYQGGTLCKNEDSDYTGNINSLGVVGGHPVKDYNQNNVLDPGNVAVASPGSGTTDANGRFDVKITYPRDHAYWVKVALVASATVAGTQSNTTSTFLLPGALSDYACASSPPGFFSPYGVGGANAPPGVCSDPN